MLQKRSKLLGLDGKQLEGCSKARVRVDPNLYAITLL
jgi:hypothetical protein